MEAALTLLKDIIGDRRENPGFQSGDERRHTAGIYNCILIKQADLRRDATTGIYRHFMRRRVNDGRKIHY